MIAVRLFRTSFIGLFRKSNTNRTPGVCRISTVALLQKYQTAKITVLHNTHQLRNEVQCQQIRQYCHGFTLKYIEETVMNICMDKAGYDKMPTDPDKVFTRNSHLRMDMGLDSLDVAELMLIVQDRFDIEIPDEESDLLNTPHRIIQYLAKRLIGVDIS